MFRLNTTARNMLLGRQASSTGNGLSGIFYQCFIDIYTGIQPTTANAAPTGTYLGTFSVDAADKTDIANGLIFGDPANGAVNKDTDNWQMTGAAAGTMGWGRMRVLGDTHLANAAYPRMDFSVATVGGDLNMASLAVTVGSSHTIDDFPITMPTH